MSKTFPFQSGSCLCHRSTDYDMIGGDHGQYENVKGAKVMIPRGSSRVIPSAPYATTVLNRTNSKQFMNTNLGVGYSTTGGANKNHNKKHHKKKHHSNEHHGKKHHSNEHHGKKHHNNEHHNNEHHGKKHHGKKHHGNCETSR